MATARKLDPEAQAGPQHPSEKPGEKPTKEKEGYPGAPDDTWKKDSEPHPITPGKPAPQGPDVQNEPQPKAVGANAPAPRFQPGTPMPAPTFATGSTLMNPYKYPLPGDRGPAPAAGPQTPPMGVYAPATPTIVSASPLPGATHGVAYSPFAFGASGGILPYTWTATGVPAGMTLSTDGVLSGTPTSAGTPTISVTVTDATKPTGQTNNKSFSLTVA